MGRWTAGWRLQFENEIREEPDGKFIVRPLVSFGRPYVLPDLVTKERFISNRIRIKNIVFIWSSFVIIMIFIILFFTPSILQSFPSNIFMYLAPLFFLFQFLLETIFAWRTLWMLGGRPVPRVRWRRAYSTSAIDLARDPFASAESGQLGGVFIILVALTTLLASIVLASYLGPPGRDAGMPYVLFLMVLIVTGWLAVAIWRELWLRERRNGSP